ncbi:MAG: winged helix DNA-binding domain-containing protein [Microbacterium sp.]
MTSAPTIDLRLHSHLLSAPAATVAEAARHMLATQGQEFWGGRWALAARTAGAPTMRDVDAAFDRGEVVRSWTMRGTIHLIPREDLAWVLSVTGERQRRSAAAVHRREGIDAEESARVEAITRAALRGGDRLTRAELVAAFQTAGVSTVAQRGYHLLTNLSLSGVICQGPIVARDAGPTREQYFVLCDDWIGASAEPSDPLAEFFVRYIAGHGPAGARDFAWWTGLPLGVARAAAESASDRLALVGDDPEPQYIAAASDPVPAAETGVLALPPFEEYYIPYVDRTVACAPDLLPSVGPTVNGMVRPIILARGVIAGVWAHSHAVGRHTDAPAVELFSADAAAPGEVTAALDRYHRFVVD